MLRSLGRSRTVCPVNVGEPLLFALSASREFGEQIAAALGLPVAEHEERLFEDGEQKARPLVNVRGRDAYVIQSLQGGPDLSVHDKLCRLLFFIGGLKDAAAARVTAVVPYLCYARKDRKTKSRDPVTNRYVAALFDGVGTDCVVTLDVHNLAAYQNAYRRTEHLEARPLFVRHFAPLLERDEVAVVSPDVGGAKRADALREALSAALGRRLAAAFVEKQRSSGVVSGEAVAGEVRGRVAIIVDDLIATGTTIVKAARACRDLGATRVFAAAAHGLFTGEADHVLADDAVDRIVVTNTVPTVRLREPAVLAKIDRLDAAPLFAEAIRRMHDGGSLAELLEP